MYIYTIQDWYTAGKIDLETLQYLENNAFDKCINWISEIGLDTLQSVAP